MRLHRTALVSLLGAVLGAAALSACDSARPVVGLPPSAVCTQCHGGTDNTTGAPPRATNGATAVGDMGVGSHSKHLAAGVACGTCHTVPDAVSFPGHLNGKADVVFNEFAKKNIPAGQQGSMWNASAGTCAVYCHGTGLNLGGALITPVWNAPPQNGLGCVSCHAAPPETAPGVFLPPHSRTMALTDCAGCHSTSIVNVGNVPTFKPGGTHLDGSANVSISGCTGCHGDANRTETVSLNQAAPPKDTQGNLASPEVGAHQAHLHAGALAGAFACATCHVVPGDQAHATANLGDAKVVFSGLGAKNARAAFAGSTCSNVYCHGATISGGTTKNPSWAGGASQVTCGTCHGAPPAIAPHSASMALTACSGCHAGTVTAGGTIVVGGGHINGTVEASGAPPHPVPFPPAQHGPVAKGGVDSCKACHGADLSGGVAPSCTACHAANGHPTWQTECTFCHGSTRTADGTFTPVGNPAVRANLAGPPLAATTRPLGAHEAHFSNDPATGNQLSLPILCEQCHGTLPIDFASHMNGSVAIGWGTLATGNGTTTPTPAPVAGQLPAASDVAAGPTCANYCHGATIGGGTNKNPSWTGGASQAACGTCHGFPPPAPHTQTPTTAAQCNACHPDTVNADGTINKTRHVNGAIEATGAPPHPVPFPPAQHGPVAKGGVSTCTACHGINLDGGSAPSCTACHAANGHPTWQTECTFCHGSTRTADATFTLVGNPAVRANLAGPPLAATTRPIGAHEAHFGNDPTAGNQLSLPILCEQCHGALPTDFASHMNGAVAIFWGPLATGNGTTTPTPAPVAGQLPVASDVAAGPTCANYCHGATLAGGGNTTPLWTGGASQASCGACHGIPMPYTLAGGWHVQNTACGTCHTGYTSSSVAGARASHVNGTVNVVALTCTTCHALGAPFTATDGSTAPTSVRVGAHNKHLQQTITSPAISCADCHALPGQPKHANGAVNIAWGTRATLGGVTVSPAAGTVPTATAVNCTNYCHGAALPAPPTGTTLPRNPAWTGTLTGCTTCHRSPGEGEHRNGVHDGFACSNCHNSVISSGSTTITAPNLHINGVRDFQLAAGLGSFTKSGATYNCAASCHDAGATHSAAAW